MSRDHYVAQTYLKHFGDPSRKGMLNAYRKSDGAQFPCWPKDVCHEWDGDLNPRWLAKDPGILGEVRNFFEQLWNPSIKNLVAGRVDSATKFAISGLFANLMCCTPTWRRLGVQMHNWHVTQSTLFGEKMRIKHGQEPAFPEDAIEALKRGEISLETDPEYIKAMMTEQQLDHAWAVYHADWVVIRNSTGLPFVTGDYPMGFECLEQMAIDGRTMISTSATRYLPISPRLCLSVHFGQRTLMNFEPTMDSMGRLRFMNSDEAEVKRINILVAKCAENLIFSSQKSDVFEELAATNAKFSMVLENVEIENPEEVDTIYHGSLIRIRERPG